MDPSRSVNGKGNRSCEAGSGKRWEGKKVCIVRATSGDVKLGKTQHIQKRELTVLPVDSTHVLRVTGIRGEVGDGPNLKAGRSKRWGGARRKGKSPYDKNCRARMERVIKGKHNR